MITFPLSSFNKYSGKNQLETLDKIKNEKNSNLQKNK